MAKPVGGTPPSGRLALIGDSGINTQFRIADTTDQFDSSFIADRAELNRVIDRMRPMTSPVRFPALDGTEDVYVITDGVSPLTVPNGTVPISVFEPAPNVGITAFDIAPCPPRR